MPSLRLREITTDNVMDACRLKVRPEQEEYVAPVVWSLAAAYAYGERAWPRVVYDGDDLVAFIMGAFDPGNENPSHRCGIWRLNVSADYQGRGYGKFAVRELIAEARRRGQQRVTVSWVPGEHSPEAFYLKLGFRPTGEVVHGEVEGELLLDRR